jgi:hypothetical protein
VKQGNKGKCPQEIHNKYPEYDEVITSKDNVNQILIEDPKQLHNFITGEN